MNYSTAYYHKHADKLNEKRLLRYYTKKLGAEYVNKMIETHPNNVLEELKKTTKRLTKIQKIERTILMYETIKQNL